MDKKSTPNDQIKAKTPPKKRKKITQTYLENAGAYYLQRFSASVAQFRKVMERKINLSCRDHPEQDKSTLSPLLDAVVTKFENLGYLNDRSYAENLVHALIQKGASQTRMAITLKQKGLTAEMIESVMPERSREDEKHSALLWAKKKRLAAYSTRIRDNEKQKSMASLARAGFDYDIANWVTNLSREDADDLMDSL